MKKESFLPWRMPTDDRPPHYREDGSFRDEILLAPQSVSFSVEPGSGHCLEYGNIVFLPLPGPSENREGEDNGQPRAPVRNTRMKE